MKKIILIMAVSLLGTTSLAISSSNSLNQIDKQKLFKTNKNDIITLSHNELKNTKGKYYWSHLRKNWNIVDLNYYVSEYMSILDRQRKNNYFSLRESIRDSDRMFNIGQLVLYNFGIWLPTH